LLQQHRSTFFRLDGNTFFFFVYRLCVLAFDALAPYDLRLTGFVGDLMSKVKFYLSVAAVLGTSLFPSVPSLAQTEKGDLAKKQAQAEVVADSSQYVIGAEDVLYIHTWKEEALSRTVPVRMDGKISIPLIDEVQAAGLTPLQLKEILIEKFKKFIDNPSVSVIVMEANSFKVYVSGQVRTPGVYRLRGETTLLQIIPMAGGFTDWANQKKILIIRKENGVDKRLIMNYKKIVEGKEPISSSILKSGDTIIVP
jgi:polysaccharide export outer membrane protein